jgi:hypothetical protein
VCAVHAEIDLLAVHMRRHMWARSCGGIPGGSVPATRTIDDGPPPFGPLQHEPCRITEMRRACEGQHSTDPVTVGALETTAQQRRGCEGRWSSRGRGARKLGKTQMKIESG